MKIEKGQVWEGKEQDRCMCGHFFDTKIFILEVGETQCKILKLMILDKKKSPDGHPDESKEMTKDLQMMREWLVKDFKLTGEVKI